MQRFGRLGIALVFTSSLACAAFPQQNKTSRPASPTHRSPAKTAKDSPSDIRRDTAFNIMTEAYDSSRNLPAEDRLRLMIDLCNTAQSMTQPVAQLRVRPAAKGLMHRYYVSVPPGSSSELTKKQRAQVKSWIEELYAMAQEFPPNSERRMQAEFSSTRAMVVVDSDRAIEMLDAAEVFTIRDHPWSMRQAVATTLFDALYQKQGMKAIPVIRRKALQFGDEDDYPFRAISSLLHQLNGHPEALRQLFSDALTAYRRSSQGIQSTFSFLSFLSTPDIRKQLETSQVLDAAQEIASHAKQAVQFAQQNRTSTSPGLRFIIQGIRSTLNEFAPEIAATIPDPSSITVPPAVPPVPQVKARAPESDSVKELRKEFEATRTAVMVLNEDEIHEGPQMVATIDKAVDLGAELVSQTGAGDNDDRDAGAGLIDVVQVGARVNPSTTLGAIRRIQDDKLRAEMLLSLAQVIQNLR